jgi:phosphopantetheinyl transferase
LVSRSVDTSSSHLSKERNLDVIRTPQGKPKLGLQNKEKPYFNFNISHHGDWVLLGADSRILIGVDIMDVPE